MLFAFLWKHQRHYIKKSVVINSFEHGGFNFLDFASLNSTFKINWLRQFLYDSDSIWNAIPNYIFSKVGPLSVIILCNYNISKLPIKLSNFHKQLILAWHLIYKHNFSPNRYFIWNNHDIRYKNKTLFFSDWFNNNILLVSVAYNSNGHLFSYSEFLTKYCIPVETLPFATVFGAIPNGVIMLFKGHNSFLTSSEIPLPDPADMYVGRTCFKSTLKNNRDIRFLFLNDSVSTSHVVTKWNALVENISWKKVWTLPNKYLRDFF
ncbi:hypothetical protein PO909_018079 [Leuciscus waleckii]